MNSEKKMPCVMCKVTDCTYHAMDDKCTATKIEVCNCHDCNCTSSKEDVSFCSTYKKI